jgi:hypothetical protein
MALNDNIIAIERFAAVTVKDGFGREVMTLRMAEFIEAITAQANQNKLTIGNGSPEGVFSANPGAQYVDEDAFAGSNSYVKLAGSGNTGWTLM